MASNFTLRSEEDKKKLYECVKRYVLPVYSLGSRGYPTMDAAGRVTVVRSERRAPPQLPNPNERLCYRCRKRFVINPNGTFTPSEQCIYHLGGVWNRRHTCCQKPEQSVGCCTAESHVHRENRYRDLVGYVKTSDISPTPSNSYDLYSLDCEMIYTSHGLELAQVTVVDSNLKPVIDELVKPPNPVVEWNTRFSGITSSMMRDVTTTLSDIQQRLLELFNNKTILIGHSPEFDLCALKLVHSNVVDTGEVFIDPSNPRYKKPLKDLVREKLHRTIQSDRSQGHDSLEDAVACMELMMWKVNQDLSRRRF